MLNTGLLDPGVATENRLPNSLDEVSSARPKQKVTPEAHLIAEILAGNQDAFPALVQPYLRLFTSGIHRILLDDLQTQQALTQALLAIRSGLPSGRGKPSFPAWAYRICLEEALVQRRSRAWARTSRNP